MFLLISELQWWDPSHQNASHVGKEKKTETPDLQKKAWKLPGNPLCIFPRPKKAVFSAGLLSGRVVIHG
jgi:hypothetical protein